MLSAAAGVAALALFYAALLDPALTGRADLNENLPTLRQQLAQLQTMSREAAQFSGKTALPPALSEQGIKAALARQGMQPQQVVLGGGMVRVQLNNVSFAALLEWLDGMQKNARLAVTEARVTALAKPGRVDAALTLRQPRIE
jgi:general secretion pathway protein M